MPLRHSLLTSALCLHKFAAAILGNPDPCGNLTYRIYLLLWRRCKHTAPPNSIIICSFYTIVNAQLQQFKNAFYRTAKAAAFPFYLSSVIYAILLSMLNSG